MILVLSLVTFIVACAAASHGHEHEGHDAITFVSIWTSVLLLLVGAAGTMTLRKHHDHLSVGTFTGIIGVMTQQMLIIFAIYAEHASQHASEGAKDSENAMAAFSMLLFLAFVHFYFLLCAFKDDVARAESRAQREMNEVEGPDGVGSPSDYSIGGDQDAL